MNIINKLNELAKKDLTQENVNKIVSEFDSLYQELIYARDKDLDLNVYFVCGEIADDMVRYDNNLILLSDMNINEYYIAFCSFVIAVKDDINFAKQTLLDISKEVNIVFN